ncbi:hypothetical protein LH449_10520, partial [Laribacter hongkongensis]|nr:hypothetical protein [Laribacter hongkongensis]
MPAPGPSCAPVPWRLTGSGCRPLFKSGRKPVLPYPTQPRARSLTGPEAPQAGVRRLLARLAQGFA